MHSNLPCLFAFSHLKTIRKEAGGIARKKRNIGRASPHGNRGQTDPPLPKGSPADHRSIDTLSRYPVYRVPFVQPIRQFYRHGQGLRRQKIRTLPLGGERLPQRDLLSERRGGNQYHEHRRQQPAKRPERCRRYAQRRELSRLYLLCEEHGRGRLFVSVPSDRLPRHDGHRRGGARARVL